MWTVSVDCRFEVSFEVVSTVKFLLLDIFITRNIEDAFQSNPAAYVDISFIYVRYNRLDGSVPYK